jgi:hypothetical protein
MKRRPRTIITRVIVFLLLGAIVNVAVAWGLSTQFRIGAKVAALNDIFPGHFNNNYPLGERGPQITWMRPGLGEMKSFVVAQNTQFEQRVVVSNIGHEAAPPEVKCRVAAGWPLLSASTLWLERQEWNGIHMRSEWWIAQRMRMPLWPGFAINTIFYAAILWALFFAPGSVRRMIRRRRGLCPACAYPIGTSPVCTECGTTLSSTACNAAPGGSCAQ